MLDNRKPIVDTLVEDIETPPGGDSLETSAEINVAVFDAGSKKFSDVLSDDRISEHPALVNLEANGVYALCFTSDEKLIPSILLNSSTMYTGSGQSPVLSKEIKHLAGAAWCLPGGRTATGISSRANTSGEREYKINKLKRSQRCVASVGDIVSIAGNSNRNVEAITLPGLYDDMPSMNANGYVSMVLAFAAAVINMVNRIPGTLPDGGVLIVRGLIPEVNPASNGERVAHHEDNLCGTVDTLPAAPFEVRYCFRNGNIFNYNLGDLSQPQSSHRIYIGANNGRVSPEVLDVLDRVYLNRCVLAGIFYAMDNINAFRGGVWYSSQNEYGSTLSPCVDPQLLEWFLHILLGNSYDIAVDEILDVMGEDNAVAGAHGLVDYLDYPVALDGDMFMPDSLVGLATSRTIETPRTQDISRAVEKMIDVLCDVCSMRDVAYTSYKYFPKRLGDLRVVTVQQMLAASDGWYPIYSRGLNGLRILGNRIREMDRMANVDIFIDEYITSGLDVADIVGSLGTNTLARRRIRP